MPLSLSPQIDLLEQPLVQLLSCPICSDLKSVKARKHCSEAAMVSCRLLAQAGSLKRAGWSIRLAGHCHSSFEVT